MESRSDNLLVMQPGQSVESALSWALIRRTPTAFRGQLVLCAITMVAAFSSFSSSLWFWLAILTVLGSNFVRVQIAKVALRNESVSERSLQVHRYAILLSALAWSALSMLIFAQHGTFDPLAVNTLLILCGLMAGGSASLAPSPAIFRVFGLILCVSPTLFSCLGTTNEWSTWMLPFVTIAYFAFMMRQAQTQHDQLADLAAKEKQLHEAESKFHSIAENIPGMVFQLEWETHHKLNFVFVSASAESFLGFPISELLERMHPEDRNLFEASLAGSAETLGPWSWEGRIRSPGSPEWRWLQGASTPQRGSGNVVCFSGLLLEVTPLKQAEFQVERERARALNSARMASLGEMASGVAHEINNPLAILSAKAQLLVTFTETNQLEPERVKRTASALIQTCDRIARIVRGLRTFAREGSDDPFFTVSVQEIIEESLDLCRARFENHGVALLVGPIPENAYIECRKSQIEQVLINLLNNAFDAVDKMPDPWVEVEVLDLPHSVLLRVTDAGLGIPDEVAQKLAQPFFTTKEVGRGTGLGLSISSGIMRQHNGKLSLDRAHTNTRFEIELPKVQNELKQAA